MPLLRELGEWGLIAALRDRFSDLPPGWIGIGDDTAVGTLPAGHQVLTTVDLLVEDKHFRRATAAPFEIGWKALAVNLSDIASMGGTPAWAVLGLALPGELEAEWVLGFYDGLAALAKPSGCRIVGGDTVGSPGPIMISVTVIGETPRPLLRTGARVGDWVFATGPAGASAAGLWCIENPGRVEASALDRVYVKALRDAHLKPVPQLAAGRAIQSSGIRVAMLDNSDGIARCALVLAEANGMGIRLEQGDLPIDAPTRAVAGVAGIDPAVWALEGGEDYHLVGTVAPADWGRLATLLESVGTPLFRLGEVTPGPGRAWVRDPDQHTHELASVAGFQHFETPPAP